MELIREHVRTDHRELLERVTRRRAELPPPAPDQPGPFSLAGDALAEALTEAGFGDVRVETITAPLRLASARECVHFEQESFGALHQMLGGLDDAGRDAAWAEIASELGRFEGPGGFEGPCELLVGVGVA